MGIQMKIISFIILLTILSSCHTTVFEKGKIKYIESQEEQKKGTVETVSLMNTKYQCLNLSNPKEPKYLSGFFIDADYYTKCYYYYEKYNQTKKQLDELLKLDYIISERKDYTYTYILTTAILGSFIIGGLTVYSLTGAK